MFTIEKILAVMPHKSVDLSLVAYLDFLASKASIETVDNIHVFTAIHLYQHLNETSEKYGDVLLARIKEDMEEQLAGHLQNVPNKKIKVAAGISVSELLRKKHNSSYGLIAFGGQSESDLLLAKQIVRHIPGNALFVPEKAEKKLSHILVPVDLSKHSSKILSVAIRLKQMLGEAVKITCYHSFEIPNISSYNILRTEHQFHEMVKKNNHEALQRFVATTAGEDRSEIEEIVQEQIYNRPDRAILDYIKNNNVDFVIMGAKGHSGIDAWLGSTVERVMAKNDYIPMLIVK